MKSLWLPLAIVGLIPSMAIAQESSRDEYIAEIVKDLGIEDLLVQVQKDGREHAQSQVDRMLGQLKDVMSRLSDAKQQQFREAVARFIAAATQPIDTSEAAAEWGRLFAADMTNDELKTIAQNMHTTLGKKQLKAAANAATQWANYLRDKQMAQIDKATAQYVADLKAIIGGAAQASASPETAPSKESPVSK